MTNATPTRRCLKPSEEGYILIAVIFMLAILILTLSVAAPKIAKEIQRDRERETMERGKQYIRAIKLYYKKFGAYPPNIDALVKTSEIRFLRKRYIDPTTGKDDWRPILFGQAKTQTLGFFGQPLAGAGSAGGSVMAGIGPSGGNASGLSGLNSSFGSSSAFGATDSGTGTGSSTPTDGSSTNASGNTGSPGTSGGSAFGTNTGLSGKTFGGAGIVGFAPMSPKQSILVYKKKNHYSEWEFVYDPLTDMVTVSGNTGNIGQPASSTTNAIGSPGFNSPSSTTTTTTTPQQ
jgi:type II secretory pathway pseudopilin PulG